MIRLVRKLKEYWILIWIVLFFVLAFLVFKFNIAGYILSVLLIVELCATAITIRNAKRKHRPINLRDKITGVILFFIGAGIWYLGIILPATASGDTYPTPSAAVKGMALVIGYVLIGGGIEEAFKKF